MIDMEIKVQYFNGETLESVEYTHTWALKAETLADARNEARSILEVEKSDAYINGAMMDTYYFSYDFLVPQHLLVAE